MARTSRRRASADIAWFDEPRAKRSRNEAWNNPDERALVLRRAGRNGDGKVPILTCLLQRRPARTTPSACRRPACRRGCCSTAPSPTAPERDLDGRGDRGRGAQRRADAQPRQGRGVMSGFARALPFGATLISPRPHALSPVGAGAARGRRRDRGPGAAADDAHRPRAGSKREAPLRRGRALPLSPGEWPGACPIPASRAQAGDVHGPSLVVDPGAYRWRHPGWRGRPWHETVLYELHAGTSGRLRRRRRRALPGLAGARHHRRRADADQRFSRHAQLGL